MLYMAEGKRIVIFNFRGINHPDAGGSERSSYIMAKIMVDRGYDVTFFCSGFKGSKKEEVIDGIKYVMMGNLYSVYIYAFFYYLFKLRKKIDYVIEDINGIPWFMPLYVFKRRVTLIHHVHSKVFFQELNFFVASIAYLMERSMALFYRFSKILAVSPETKKELVKLWLPAKNIDLVYNGIDEGFYVGKKSKDPIVVAIGRVKKYKRLDLLVNIFEKVLVSVPKAKLMIVGAGDDLDEIKNLVKSKGLENKVICTGYVSDEEKKRILSTAWVYCITSSQEGWGIGCIEANASGVPVVAYAVGGLIDSVKDGKTGFLIKDLDEEDFVKKLILLLKDNKLRDKMGKESMKLAKNFTWEKWTDKFIEVLGE